MKALLLVLATSFFSLNLVFASSAKKCVDFTGEWVGVCTSIDGSTYNFTHLAKQDQCKSIEWDGEAYKFGITYGTSEHSGNEHSWHSIKFDIKNRKTLTLSSESTSYNHKTEDGSRLSVSGKGKIVNGEFHTVVQGQYVTRTNGVKVTQKIKDVCVFQKK